MERVDIGIRTNDPGGGERMDHVFAAIALSNPRQPKLSPINASALADTGGLMLCIPEHLALQLRLET